MAKQNFFLVSDQFEYDWPARVKNDKHIDAICGLGKEKATSTAEGWLARAVYLGEGFKNIYSVQYVPPSLTYSWPSAVPVMDPISTPEQEYLMKRTSFLTLGGWDKSDYRGNITWFNTIEGAGWN